MDLYFTLECHNREDLLSTYAYRSKNLLRLNMKWQRLIPKEGTKS